MFSTVRVFVVFSALALVPFALLATPASATIYYVRKTGNDSNNGKSAGAAWSTINKAAQTLAAGDTCYVGAGTYSERVKIYNSSPTCNQGTAGNPIILCADTSGTYTGDAGAVHVTQTMSSNKYCFDIYSRDYWRILGFTVHEADFGISFWNCNGCYADACTVYNCRTAAIALDTISSSFTLWNCDCYNSKWGVAMYNSISGLIHGCRAYGNSSDGYAIWESSQKSSVITIENSQAYSNTGHGMRTDYCNTVTANNCIFRNNSSNGVNNGAGCNLVMQNCTIYGNSQAGVYINTTSTVTNCISANNATYGFNKGSSGTFTHTYNNLFGNTTSAYNGCSASTGEVTGNPNFTNAASGDLTLQSGSAAINTGTTIAGLTQDGYGTTRPQGSAYDMGFYEKPGSGLPPGVRVLHWVESR